MTCGPPISTRTHTLVPDTSLVRSQVVHRAPGAADGRSCQAALWRPLAAKAPCRRPTGRWRGWRSCSHCGRRQPGRLRASDDCHFHHGGYAIAVMKADILAVLLGKVRRSEEHTSELQSLMRISYAVFCLKKKKKQTLTDNPIT